MFFVNFFLFHVLKLYEIAQKWSEDASISIRCKDSSPGTPNGGSTKLQSYPNKEE